MLLSALESYKEAIKKDAPFILPLLNAIDCCSELQRPDLLAPFMDALGNDWSESLEAKMYLAFGLSLQGRQGEAAELYCEILQLNDVYLDPDEWVRIKNNEEEDLTLLGGANMEQYKNLARSLLKSGNFDALDELRTVVSTWTAWKDGDWDVFHAEALRLQGENIRALSVVHGMPEQFPPLVTEALCALEDGNFKSAGDLAKKIVNSQVEAAKFTHPEGRPDAVAQSILALVALEDGLTDKAIELADDAIKLDVGCPIARTTYATALLEKNKADDACRALKEGLVRRPGSPALTRMVVEALVDIDCCEEAQEVLANQRPLLEQNHAPSLGPRLGELIALTKLSNYESEIEFSDFEMHWANNLSQLSRSWLKSNLEIKNKKLNLPEASTFYLVKIIEKEFGEKIFVRFRETLRGQKIPPTEDYSDFSRFLLGDYAPSLGAVNRILRRVAKPQNDDEPVLITKFREYLFEISDLNKEIIFAPNNLKKLNSLAHLRNSLAHVGEPDVEKMEICASYVLTNNEPGPLLLGLGF